MHANTTPVTSFTICNAERRAGRGMIDPIHVVLYEPVKGTGSLTITCYGLAWTCWWGAMGDCHVREFLRSVDAGYVVGCLVRGQGQFQKARRTQDRERDYLVDIVAAVQRALAAGVPA